jgi:hypothetical protein
MCAAAAVFAPVHAYDLVVMVPIGAAIPFVALRHMLWLAPLYLMAVRHSLVASLMPFPGSTTGDPSFMLASLSALGIFMVLALLWARGASLIHRVERTSERAGSSGQGLPEAKPS